MKTGNKTQAIALSIAALGAIGFLVTRLIPQGPAAAQDIAAREHGSGGKSSTQDGLPTEIIRDAFSHPALTERFLEMKNPGAKAKALEVSNPINFRSPFEDSLPQVDRDAELVLQRAAASDPKKKPSVNTEFDQQEEKKPALKIRLKAIMRATKTLALISLDGGADLILSPGDQLTGDIRVGAFSSDSVSFISPTEKFSVTVGQEVEK